MEFSDVVRRRRMVRNYAPDRAVPDEIVERLLEHAIRAPSAGFSQGWAFLVLREPVDRELFWRVTTDDRLLAAPAQVLARDDRWPAAPAQVLARDPGAGEDTWLRGMRRAPLIVVPHSNRDQYLDRYAEPDKGWTDRDEARWPVPFWHIDAGFAALLMLLTAVDEGLGACFFGIPPTFTDAYRAAFGVPPEYAPIGALTIGYPAADRRSPSLKRGRRPVDMVTHRGRWATSSDTVPGT